MQEECIVCKAPLIYLEQDEWMECELCHKKELSKTRCQNGHYVCNDCHTKGLDTILSLCIDRNIQKSDRDCPEDDGCIVLPYAWTGASCHGGSGAAYCI